MGGGEERREGERRGEKGRGEEPFLGVLQVAGKQDLKLHADCFITSRD